MIEEVKLRMNINDLAGFGVAFIVISISMFASLAFSKWFNFENNGDVDFRIAFIAEGIIAGMCSGIIFVAYLNK